MHDQPDAISMVIFPAAQRHSTALCAHWPHYTVRCQGHKCTVNLPRESLHLWHDWKSNKRRLDHNCLSVLSELFKPFTKCRGNNIWSD